MKRFIPLVATLVLVGALGTGWSADKPSLTPVKLKPHPANRHHAHKAGKHHPPKHHRTV